jgi:hypothetical protein
MNLGGVDKGEDNQKEGVDRWSPFKEMLPLAMDFGIRSRSRTMAVSRGRSKEPGVIQGTDPKWVEAT